MASQRISVRIPKGIAQRLKHRTRVTGVCESVVVRQALEEYLAKDSGQPTAYDRALEAGLIGCVRGGPKDLSTNKKYFKGFGKSR